LNVATPPLTVPVPSVVAPSLNVTEPVAGGLDTVAVSSVAPPYVIVDGLAPSVVVVAASVTVTPTAELVAPAKFVSPL
jgi:hypothetical protein